MSTPRIPVNLINGSLGAGKTTLIRQLLKQKPPHENWALLINEFGQLGIDGVLIEPGGQLYVKQLAGGCICCTVKQDLKQALQTLIERRPHRLIVEPTGLSEPDTLADLFLTPALKPHYELHQIVSIFDSASTSADELSSLSIMQSLLHMADIIVLNKTDLATTQQIDALCHVIEQTYPPKNPPHLTHQAWLDVTQLNKPHQTAPLRIGHAIASPPHASPFMRKPPPSSCAITTESPFSAIVADGIIQRTHHQALDAQTFGWCFDAQTQFNWQSVQNLLQQLTPEDGVLRAKGLFRTGNSWMLFQWTAQQVTRELVAYRKDSRFEIITSRQHRLDLAQIEQALHNAQSH